VEALFDSVLTGDYSSETQVGQLQLPGFDTPALEQRDELFRQWDASSEREKRSRTLFAQYSIKTEEVEQELREVQEHIGLANDVASFTTEALRSYGAFVNQRAGGLVEFDLREVPVALRDAVDLRRYAPGKDPTLRVSFSLSGQPDRVYLSRTHPLVEGLAAYVMDTALDAEEDPLNRPIARRGGLIRTSQVQTRTTLLLVRLRFHIRTPARAGGELQPLLAEDCAVFAFRGVPQNAQWFDEEQEIAALLQAHSEANTASAQIQHFLRQALDGYQQYLAPHLEVLARERAEALREAHRRVRRSAALSVDVTVEPQLPPDILGVYVYLPNAPQERQNVP